MLGETEDELRSGLKEFFYVKLNMPTDCVKEDEVQHVRRVRLRRGRQNQGEVVVLFNDIETRDRVVSYARNLAPFVDEKGKPTAGVRFDIPDHLTGVHKTLLQYGHALWTKYNKDQDFKRNIRFDDTEKSFCMNVKLPGKQSWITVDHGRALADKRKNRASVDEDLLSTVTAPPTQEMETDGLPEATGAAGLNGSVMSTSWRAPTNK